MPASKRRADIALRRCAVFALSLCVLALAVAPALAQRPRVYAITGATVIGAPGQVLEGATVVVRDGLIEAVGIDVAIPADAETIDGDGLTIWPAFIDPYSHLGLKPSEGGGGGFSLAALFSGPDEPEPGTGHPIELVHPQYRVNSHLISEDGAFEKHREIGFGTALSAPRDGIFRGSSVLVALRDAHPRDYVIKSDVTMHMGFDSGQFFGGYPSDILGTISTMRQVMYDVMRYAEWQARWQANPGMQRPETNDALAALVLAHANPVPPVFHSTSLRQIEAAIRLADEFGGQAVVLGTGNEYEMLPRLEGTGVTVLVPLDFPEEPDVSSDERLPRVSLQSLRRWENAAANAGALEAAGIRFALTPYGMGNVGKFTENVRKAIEAGLTADAALAALTTTPADLYGVAYILGTVEAGKIASFAVGTGAPFDEDTEIRHMFVDGEHYEMEEKEQIGDPDAVVDPRGVWAVTATVMGNAQNSTWTIEGSPGAYSGRSVGQRGENEFESVTLEGNALTVVLVGPMGNLEATVVIEGDEFEGHATIDAPGGQTFSISFKGERTSGPEGGLR